MIGHPAPRRLLDFLDGRLDDVVRRRVASHLADCQRCRDQVQGLRRVRTALAPDGTEPSAALWRRILASRAAGEVVLLPQVLDDAPPRAGGGWTTRRLALGRYAAAAALLAATVLALRMALPALALRAHFTALSRTAADFWSRSLVPDAPAVLARIDAPPARPVVAGLRPLVARYEVRRYVDGVLVSVDSATTLTVQPMGRDWQVQVTESGDGTTRTMVAVLDGQSLTLRTLRSLRAEPYPDQPGVSGFIRSYRVDVLGDSLAITETITGRNRDQPRTARSGPDRFRGTIPPGTVVDQGEWGVRAAQMTAVPLHRRWFGSFGFLLTSERSASGPHAEPVRAVSLYPISYRVVGEVTLDLPIGPTRAWQLERWTSDGADGLEREYYRESDGLLAAQWTDPGISNRTEQRLLSVSYR